VTFVYDHSNGLAHDAELGLKIDRDTRFRGEAPPALVFRDTAGQGSWICPITYIQARLPDPTASTPRTYLAEVGCRISRKDLAPIARAVAEAKVVQGFQISADDMERRLLEGATVYTTGGGRLLASVADFEVILTA
jgi:hypothetical protein